MDERAAVAVLSPGFSEALPLPLLESSWAEPAPVRWMREQWDGLGTAWGP